MRGLLLTILTLLLSARHVQSQPHVIRSAKELTCFQTCSPTSAVPFEITARVTYVRKGPFYAIGIVDETGGALLNVREAASRDLDIKPGDIANFSGVLKFFSPSRNIAQIAKCSLVRHAEAPAPVPVTIADLLTGRFNYQLTRVTGILRDAVTSETAPGWRILVVYSRNDRIFISVPTTEKAPSLDHLVGRHISTVGICLPSDYSPRKWFGPTFKVASPDDISDCDRDNDDTNAIPFVDEISCTSPDSLFSLGHHQATGTVVAVWGDRSAVIKTPTDHIGLEFSHGPLPSHGQTIRVVGLPESDLYRINLTQATWSALPAVRLAEPPPERILPAAIISGSPTEPHVNTRYFGKLVQMEGRVISVTQGERTGILQLESGGRIIAVHATGCPSALAGLAAGYNVDVTGVCILAPFALRRPSQFPRLHEFLIALRSPSDIRILSKPSWWTPARLAIVIGILLFLVTVTVIWNATLRVAVRMKSKALLKEQTAKIEETLKIDERTRLAAELHDYLAQNLTVVSYQISSAQNAMRENRPDSTRFIDNADKMLQSCRTDLRHCLWDLKNDALNEPDFSKAILRTTALVAGDATVLARFDIRRTRLSDSTAHAILSICRELVANAVRHGKAKTVRIAGELKDGMIRFSVRDDGHGFDPAHRQGPEQGHFGLSGIVERIKRLHGRFEIHSSPESGTRIVVTVTNREIK